MLLTCGGPHLSLLLLSMFPLCSWHLHACSILGSAPSILSVCYCSQSKTDLSTCKEFPGRLVASQNRKHLAVPRWLWTPSPKQHEKSTVVPPLCTRGTSKKATAAWNHRLSQFRASVSSPKPADPRSPTRSWQFASCNSLSSADKWYVMVRP